MRRPNPIHDEAFAKSFLNLAQLPARLTSSKVARRGLVKGEAIAGRSTVGLGVSTNYGFPSVSESNNNNNDADILGSLLGPPVTAHLGLALDPG